MKETAKEKAIREAWGQHWDFVSKNLNKDGSFWVYHYQEELYNWCLENTKIIWFAKGCSCFIPSSIIGIETNNGWIRIESESDLPKEEGRYKVYRRNGHESSLEHSRQSVRDLYFTSIITHYKPVQKEQPPIY